jgi:hypothetical protein
VFEDGSSGIQEGRKLCVDKWFMKQKYWKVDMKV